MQAESSGKELPISNAGDNLCLPNFAVAAVPIQYDASPVYAAPSAPARNEVLSIYGGMALPSQTNEAEENDDELMSDAAELKPQQPQQQSPVVAMGFFPYSPTWASLEKGLLDAARGGYFFLGVLCARGLSAVNRNGQDSDPYVKVLLNRNGVEDKSPLATKHVEKNLNPQWYHEFLLALPEDQGVEIELRLFDHQTFGKDKLLGFCKIPVASVNMAPERRWLPLLSGTGEVEVFTCYTRRALLLPHILPKGAVFKEMLDPLRFSIERRTYYAGELVQGVLSYSVRGTPKEVYSVQLKAKILVRYHTSHQTRDSKGHV